MIFFIISFALLFVVIAQGQRIVRQDRIIRDFDRRAKGRR